MNLDDCPPRPSQLISKFRHFLAFAALCLAPGLFGFTLHTFNTDFGKLVFFISWLLLLLTWFVFVYSVRWYGSRSTISRGNNRISNFLMETGLVILMLVQALVVLALLRKIFLGGSYCLIFLSILNLALIANIQRVSSENYFLKLGVDVGLALGLCLSSFDIFLNGFRVESLILSGGLAIISSAEIQVALIGYHSKWLSRITMVRIFGVSMLLGFAPIVALCFGHRLSKHYVLVVLLVPLVAKFSDELQSLVKSKPQISHKSAALHKIRLNAAGLLPLFYLILLVIEPISKYLQSLHIYR